MIYILLIGFLGSFTTFSAFTVDTMMLFHSQKMEVAIWNVVANVIVSMAAVFVGYYLTRPLPVTA